MKYPGGCIRNTRVVGIIQVDTAGKGGGLRGIRKRLYGIELEAQAAHASLSTAPFRPFNRPRDSVSAFFRGGAAKFARGFPGLSNRKCTGEKRGEVAGLSNTVYLDAPRLLFGAPDKFDGPSAPFRDAIADLAVRQMGGIVARISRLAAGFVQYFPFWTSRSLRYSSRLGALCSRVVRRDVPGLLLVLRRCPAMDKRARPLTCPFENPVHVIMANRERLLYGHLL